MSTLDMKNGTLFVGNPASVVYGKVVKIEQLEAQYKRIDWIDDSKSNQLGQLDAITSVAITLAGLFNNDTEVDVKNSIVDVISESNTLHSKIYGEHIMWHAKADALRAEIQDLINEIKAIVADANPAAADFGDGGVGADQTRINAMRNVLVDIINDDDYDGKFEAGNFDRVENLKTLYKNDYNDIDQLPSQDRTTSDDRDNHQHTGNDDHYTGPFRGTQEEADRLNGMLPGAIQAGDPKSYYTAAEADEYNATLTGAQTADSLNAALTGAVQEGETFNQATADQHYAYLQGALTPDRINPQGNITEAVFFGYNRDNADRLGCTLPNGTNANPLTAEQAANFNAHLVGAENTAAEAAAHNATLEGAVQEGDVKETYTAEEASEYNSTLPGAVHVPAPTPTPTSEPEPTPEPTPDPAA